MRIINERSIITSVAYNGAYRFFTRHGDASCAVPLVFSGSYRADLRRRTIPRSQQIFFFSFRAATKTYFTGHGVKCSEMGESNK